jgi:molybdate/tungstate transport system substrate-binding protein
MVAVTVKAGTRLAAVLGIACLALASASCSSAGSPSGASGSPAGADKPSGTASVAYAASLLYLNEKVVAPAFEKATGLGYTGRAGPSDGLAAEIAGGEITPNVFEAVGGDNITPLFGKFTRWYVQYASTSIVVAYNPNSKYASQFKAIASGTKPVKGLFTLMEKPGFRLGRTDPNTDPQGRAFVYMLELAQAQYHLPKDTVSKILGGAAPGSADSPQIFDEAALPARLQAGQLDASSAYQSQATQLHLPYIKLPPAINLGDAALATHYHMASVTIKGSITKHGSPLVIDITTIGKPSPAGTAYVKYVLSPAGRALYKRGGYTLIPPAAFGTTSAIPKPIGDELG